jgi:hypothetical protein
MPGQRRPELSVTQLIAGAGATVTATVAASYFGVGGTLIGAAAVSVLSTAGAAVYQHFLDRGKQQIAAKIPARVGGGGGGHDETPAAPSPQRRPWPKWYVLVAAAGGVFLAVMGLVTAFELVTGRPLATTVGGGQGRGTSVYPVRAPVRTTPSAPSSDRSTPRDDISPTARTTPEPTPTLRPTPSATAVAPPPPVRHTTPGEDSAAPAPVRSADQPRPLDDEGADQTP